jgi:hypothetical protein
MSSSYTVIDYYDLRPLDWVSGKRMPLEPGEGHVCDRCSAEHAIVYVVEDLTTHKTYSVGSGCAKASFGFDPASDKQAKRIVANKKQEAAILVSERRLEEVMKLAEDIAAEVKRLPRPPIEHLGDLPSKYPHYPGQLIRTFRMGEVTAEEWQQKDDSGWHDSKTIELLTMRWLGNEIASRLPLEWKSLTVPMDPSRPRKRIVPMYDACRSAAWRLL